MGEQPQHMHEWDVIDPRREVTNDRDHMYRQPTEGVRTNDHHEHSERLKNKKGK